VDIKSYLLILDYLVWNCARYGVGYTGHVEGIELVVVDVGWGLTLAYKFYLLKK
jgi:hypothetical protein